MYTLFGRWLWLSRIGTDGLSTPPDMQRSVVESAAGSLRHAVAPRRTKRHTRCPVTLPCVQLSRRRVCQALGLSCTGPGPCHPIPSHPIPSHHITSHHITSHHITSHHITSHHITSHHITSHHITWHGMAWHGMAWHGMAWHGMAWHGIASHCITSHHITSHCIASHHITSYHITSQLRSRVSKYGAWYLQLTGGPFPRC